MPVLSPAQLAALKAAADAPDVRRPDADLKVGDEVIVSGPGMRGHTATVTKIGPKWVTTGTGQSAMRFYRTTLHSEVGWGPGCQLYTPEQRDHDRRIYRAETRLRESGIVARRPDVSDGRVLALAALLDLLEEADAGRALLESTNPEGH
ncbi:hypothetical protein [Actinocrinis sp.]|uniref:beta barrel domain-containing protein n=1 Tax=Actinocrinis sp. TaxID=1920516 RepID=UPI002D2B73DE|nr:hypothetical protein [Actinocrinis sp.]HZP49649.1 hypothetical protein [Actinocrinis sp.]